MHGKIDFTIIKVNILTFLIGDEPKKNFLRI